MKKEVLGVPVDIIDFETVLGRIKNAIEKKELINIVTLNAEMVMVAREDNEFGNLVKQASIVTPDGIGITWALKRKNVNVNRLSGIDIVNALFPYAQDKKYKIYFFGAKEEIVTAAAQNTRTKYPGLEIITRNGYFTHDEEESIAKEIKKEAPDILLAALGVPKQEKWIKKWQSVINVPVCIGIGGTFDVLSGKLKRAPSVMRKLGLEWLYRLYKEPWRITRMQALPKFVITVLAQKG